jgi:hypothetical protein
MSSARRKLVMGALSLVFDEEGIGEPPDATPRKLFTPRPLPENVTEYIPGRFGGLNAYGTGLAVH